MFQNEVNFNMTELSDAGYLVAQLILQSYKTINSIRGTILDGIYFFPLFFKADVQVLIGPTSYVRDSRMLICAGHMASVKRQILLL